ncbi:hypothetical protein [Saccharopolyspora shandongensis]|uniref:hypothetical protein n=1 Tax=Saccharopolyspora shandongensis TaxID=418495 RepID=UPI001C4330E8|nr:hypothetical protein [Saccharopolyspora shandongensis]
MRGTLVDDVLGDGLVEVVDAPVVPVIVRTFDEWLVADQYQQPIRPERRAMKALILSCPR